MGVIDTPSECYRAALAGRRQSPAAHDHEAGPDLLGHAHDLRVGTPYPRVGARHLAQAADLHRLFVSLTSALRPALSRASGRRCPG